MFLNNNTDTTFLRPTNIQNHHQTLCYIAFWVGVCDLCNKARHLIWQSVKQKEDKEKCAVCIQLSEMSLTNKVIYSRGKGHVCIQNNN